MATFQDSRALQLKLLRLLLRPVVKFGLRHALSMRDFVHCIKAVLVDIAREETLTAGKKVNLSRITAITGIYREEVARFLEEDADAVPEPQSVLTRVIGQWESDPDFTSKRGEPRVLTYEGESNEFYKLVDRVSRNINPASVLVEIERSGVAVRTARGLRLERETFAVGTDLLSGYTLASKDIDALVQAVEENMERPQLVGQLHYHTEYDNIFLRDLPRVKKWLISEARGFHRKVRAFIAKCDKDLSERDSDAPAGGKIVIGSFSFAEEPKRPKDTD